MEAKELREMSVDDLTQKRMSLHEEIGHLKLQRATSRLENPMKLRETKRDLARVETILRERSPRAGKAEHGERGLRKERSGLVVSDRMQKTIVVSVERTVMHPKYKKILRRRTKVKAHDENKRMSCRRSRADRRVQAA